jgi:hypothetical protein
MRERSPRRLLPSFCRSFPNFDRRATRREPQRVSTGVAKDSIGDNRLFTFTRQKPILVRTDAGHELARARDERGILSASPSGSHPQSPNVPATPVEFPLHEKSLFLI